jgi:hypothetical protein
MTLNAGNSHSGAPRQHDQNRRQNVKNGTFGIVKKELKHCGRVQGRKICVMIAG